MFLDTSGLYCYLDDSDPRHNTAVSLFHSAPVRLTHNSVVSELVALCNARGVDSRVTLDFIKELTRNPDVRFVWIHREDHESAVDLLRSRPDKNYSLCDAVSFGIMRRRPKPHRAGDCGAAGTIGGGEGFSCFGGACLSRGRIALRQ